MICVTIARTRHKSMIEEFAQVAEQGAQLVELRLDYIAKNVDLKRLLEKRYCPVIATCRRREDGGRWMNSEEARQMLLRSAIAFGVDYVDLEYDIAPSIPRFGRTKRIVSYHNFEETPVNLEDHYKRMLECDPDIIKLATQATGLKDCFRMIDLVSQVDFPTIGFCMGELGSFTRILAAKFGAPFTYGSTANDRSVAPGQIPWTELRDTYRYDKINKNTPIFGVIGDPIAQSLSPLIHNLAYEEQNIDACYIPFRVPADDLARFLEACSTMGVHGLSVTIPHKEAIMPMLTDMETAADAIGAVNTVVFDGIKRIGYNTDYRAAMESLAETMQLRLSDERTFGNKTALILGAGGVARAIGWGLQQKGATVYISGRNQDKLHRMTHFMGANPVAWERRHEVPVDILVNGTPVGMFPEIHQTPYEGSTLIHSMLVFDTIYNPEHTMLINQAQRASCKVITGVDMFVRQAAYQYKLFVDAEAPLKSMYLAMRKAISPAKYLYTNDPDIQTEPQAGKSADGDVLDWLSEGNP